MSTTENKASKSSGSNAVSPKAGEPRDPEQIREEIEETREQLGETAAAVAEKTDVKKQAQVKKDELKGQAAAKKQEVTDKAKELGDKAKDAAPESAQDGVAQVQRLASENPMALAITGAFLAGMAFGRLLSR